MGAIIPFVLRPTPSKASATGVRHVAMRSVVAKEIERLISILDALDSDPDLEPSGDDEPSLGWLCNGGHSWRDGNVDLEVDQPPL